MCQLYELTHSSYHYSILIFFKKMWIGTRKNRQRIEKKKNKTVNFNFFAVDHIYILCKCWGNSYRKTESFVHVDVTSEVVCTYSCITSYCLSWLSIFSTERSFSSCSAPNTPPGILSRNFCNT